MLRHTLAMLVLPATVTVLIPIWVARWYAVQVRWPTSPLDLLLVGAGALVLAVGLLLFGASLYHFFTYGKGTLAPWDPPRRLVVRGPYRYVRNPMISGVIVVLAGEALLARSVPHAAWACTFLVINLIYIPLIEEPGLESRFGVDYLIYERNVRRFIPRLRPWDA